LRNFLDGKTHFAAKQSLPLQATGVAAGNLLFSIEKA
jgi:hypothetical protein